MNVSVYIAASVDGFIARKDGSIDWLHNPDEDEAGEDYGYQSFMDSIDVLVMGRNSYEKVLSFDDWPYADKRVIVLSHHSLTIPAELASTVEVKSSEPEALLAELNQQGVQRIYVDGGKTIQGFLRQALVNELIITRIPKLIGSGVPLFGALNDDIYLRHIATQVYSNGFVQSRYEII